MPPQTQTVTVTLSPQLKHQLLCERPTVDSSDENSLSSPSKLHIHQGQSNSTKSSDKFKRILKSPFTPFVYIALGDFDIVWNNVFVFCLAQILTLYACFNMIITPRLHGCLIVGISLGYIAGLGITAGAHRLWSHKSYKAKLPLRIFLMIAQTMAGQNSLFIWCRDHRVHHKFSETDADPHNTHRGFFFAHVGWLLRKKHPEVITKSEKLDFSDLLADPVIKFQMKYYSQLYLIFAVAIPIILPYYLFEVTFFEAFLSYVYRYVLSLHSTWFVNSTAHMFGDQPYSVKQQARENFWVSYGALGEGYHNYHHTFPFDYRTSEDGMKLNLSRAFIDLMAKIGQAYDLKTVKQDIVDANKQKVLQGSHLH